MMSHIDPNVPNRELMARLEDGSRIPSGQIYACEQPESSNIWRVLYHSRCDKCMWMLERHKQDGPMIIMAHGKTYRIRTGAEYSESPSDPTIEA